MARSMPNIRTARALSAKGRRTRSLILQTSRQVFVKQGYFAASVSEIVRRCGLSQGTFYQYFRSKEQALLELTDLMVDEFARESGAINLNSDDPKGTMRRAIGLLYHHIKDNIEFIRVLGDLELVDPVTIAYHDSLARFFRSLLRTMAGNGYILPLDPNLIAYGLIGITQFQLLDFSDEIEIFPTEATIDMTLDLLLKGISAQHPWEVSAKPGDGGRTETSSPPDLHGGDLSQGKMTKIALFQSAERIFGRMGYNRASIADITKDARVAQGTFYVHFSSKLELLEGVIRYLSRELRWALRQAVSNCTDRRDAESQGMAAFYGFIRQHRELYRIVAECDAVSPQAARWYYHKLAEGYASATEAGIQRGQIRDLPVHFLVRALMGFNHMIGMKWLIWNSSPHAEVPDHLAWEAANLIINGLGPK